VSDFKPMLASAAPENLKKLNLPVIVSPKLDGIRCLILNGQAVSRKLKPIPNEHVRRCLADLPDGLDGELMVAGSFNDVQSAIMSRDGEPEFRFCVFDFLMCTERDRKTPFTTRFSDLGHWDKTTMHPHVEPVVHAEVCDLDELRQMEEAALADGFEGLMLRDPSGPYKCGRSTTRQGWLLKLKRFADAEATIIDFEEEMENQNVKLVDALGHAMRSSNASGLVGKDTLGALICETPEGVRFGIGSGFTAQMRKDLWRDRGSLVGRLAKYKHQPDPGAKPGQAPRFPVFLGLRHTNDTGE